MTEPDPNKIPTRQILRRLGGPTAVLRKLHALGYTQTKITTLEGWSVRGSVPGWAIPVLLDIAATDGVELSHRDFIEGGEHPHEFLQ